MRPFTVLCLILVIAMCVMAVPIDNREKRSPDEDYHDEVGGHGNTGLSLAAGDANPNAAKGLIEPRSNGEGIGDEGKGNGKGNKKHKGGKGRRNGKGKPNDEDNAEFIGESPFAIISNGFLE